MHLHTDTIEVSDLREILKTTGLARRGVFLDYDREPHRGGSRKRHHRITFYLVADPGHGRRWANSGAGGSGHAKAALYDEWGAFLGEIFHRDPSAIAGHHDGADQFVKLAADYRNDDTAGGDVKREAPQSVDEWRNLYRTGVAA